MASRSINIPRISQADQVGSTQRAMDALSAATNQLLSTTLLLVSNRLITVTLPGTPTDTVVPHTLGFAPQGYVIINSDANAVVWSSSPITATTLTLRSSAAVTVTLLLIGN